MKVRTKVRAGAMSINHNGAKVKTVKVKTTIRAGSPRDVATGLATGK